MAKKFFIALLVSLLLLSTLIIVASTSDVDADKKSPIQISFTEQILSYRDSILSAQENKDYQKVKELETAADVFLNETRSADFWFSRVERLGTSNKDGSVIIQASDGISLFYLFFKDEGLKIAVKRLEKGDPIYFSGELGREWSVTKSGSIERPEYRLIPKEIKLSAHGEIMSQ